MSKVAIKFLRCCVPFWLYFGNIHTYCYGNGPNGTTKYRISSVPPLNSCIDRLFGKVYDKCVSGGVRDCFYVHTVVKREIALIPSSFRNRPLPVGREGSGLEREVWPGQEVTRGGGAFWSMSRRDRRVSERTKKRPQAQFEFWQF